MADIKFIEEPLSVEYPKAISNCLFIDLKSNEILAYEVPFLYKESISGNLVLVCLSLPLQTALYVPVEYKVKLAFHKICNSFPCGVEFIDSKIVSEEL